MKEEILRQPVPMPTSMAMDSAKSPVGAGGWELAPRRRLSLTRPRFSPFPHFASPVSPMTPIDSVPRQLILPTPGCPQGRGAHRASAPTRLFSRHRPSTCSSRWQSSPRRRKPPRLLPGRSLRGSRQADDPLPRGNRSDQRHATRVVPYLSAEFPDRSGQLGNNLLMLGNPRSGFPKAFNASASPFLSRS